MIFASSTNKVGADISVGADSWIILLVIVGVLLILDLYKNRVAHEPTTKEAFNASMFWVFCGISFSGYVFYKFGAEAFGNYFAGYLIEKSLSVDNVFVWAVIFSSFAIPVKYQHRVLFWGIFGALALRAAFIFTGSALLESFKPILFVFGGFLIFTGFKMYKSAGSHDNEPSPKILGLLEKFMPVSKEIEGQSFFIKSNGVRMATPLFAALIVVELTDVIFAVDSVPAIFAITSEPYIVLSSNAFAILGLRAMYFLLAGAKEKFYYLNHALGCILFLVGIKMIVGYWYHNKYFTWVSLAAITVILGVSIYFSLKKNKSDENLAHK